MKLPVPTIIVSGLLTLVPAIAAATDTPLRLNIDTSGRLVPVDVAQTPADGGLVVSGRIEKPWPYRGRILGHLDGDLLNQDGEGIEARQGALYGCSPTAKNTDRASFASELGALAPESPSI